MHWYTKKTKTRKYFCRCTYPVKIIIYTYWFSIYYEIKNQCCEHFTIRFFINLILTLVFSSSMRMFMLEQWSSLSYNLQTIRKPIIQHITNSLQIYCHLRPIGFLTISYSKWINKSKHAWTSTTANWKMFMLVAFDH